MLAMRIGIACALLAPAWLFACDSETSGSNPGPDSGSIPDGRPTEPPPSKPDTGPGHVGDSAPPRGSVDASTDAGGREEDHSQPPPPTGSPDATPDAGRDASVDGSTDGPSIPVATLVSSYPADGDKNVPRSTWVRLDFSLSPTAEIKSTLRLACGSTTPEADVEIDVDSVGATTLVVNPRATLGSAARCEVTFTSNGATNRIAFTVAVSGDPAVVAYDRNDTSVLDPFPDDYYLVADPNTRTGKRVDIRIPTVDDSLKRLFEGALAPTRSLDGMSPLAPIVVIVPASLAVDSIPSTATDSLDPLATAGLFDIDPQSATYGQRVAFDLIARNDKNTDGTQVHALVIYPSAPLRPRGHYAFALTNRAVVNATRPLEPSAFFTKVASKLSTTDDEKRLEPALGVVLSELQKVSPPLRTDDLALALGITVRSVDDIPKDLLSIRQTILDAPPPEYHITSVAAEPQDGDVAAIVTGTWTPLSFTTKDDGDGRFLTRDTNGKPVASPGSPIPFILALPKQPQAGAPVVIYQNGQPGSAEDELPATARTELARAGFAVIGFTDYADRVIIPHVDYATDVLTVLLTQKRLPEYMNVLTHAEQISFLRMLPTLDIDVLPLGAPDGVPDLDPSKPLGYLGMGQGSLYGTGLLAFTPQIHAAVLATGAGRFSAGLLSQQAESLYAGVTKFFPTYTWAQSHLGLAILQMDYDAQDSENLARYVYREPFDLGNPARASILMSEGLGDIAPPFFETRCGAAALGIPLLTPAPQAVPSLQSLAAPIRGNIDAATSAAFVQFVPKGIEGIPATPGCVRLNTTDGHWCAQGTAEAVTQRVDFFKSALTGLPSIHFPN